MNDQFDELARNLAKSVTRRGGLKKFGLGLAGIDAPAMLGDQWVVTNRVNSAAAFYRLRQR